MTRDEFISSVETTLLSGVAANVTAAKIRTILEELADSVYFPESDIPPDSGVDSVNGRIGTITLSKADVGLSSVDNTSDTLKPVSAAMQTALNLKAPLMSPALTGTPTAPTVAGTTDNTTKLATTAFVQAVIAALAPGGALWGAIGGTLTNQTDLIAALALKANLVSPVLTGTPTAPTAAAGTDTTQIATTAGIVAERAATATLSGKSISGLVNPLTNIPVNQFQAGQIPIANLATGTPTGFKFVADDGTLKTVPGGGDALTSNPLSQFAATTSAQLRSTLTNPTGNGAAVFGTAPNITNPTGIVKADVGLSNVDNTADTAKPVSTAQQTALDLKAPLASPTLMGTVTIPTVVGTTDNTTKAASTAFVQGVAALKADDTATISALALKAPLASPALTGTPTAPTAAVDTNTTQLATTAMVIAQAASATPANNGTAAAGTSTRYARGDHVHNSDTTKSNVASPTFTGIPAASTAVVDTNTTQLSTTAFVLAQAAGATPLMDGAAAVGTSTRFARGDHVHPVDTSRAPVASPTFSGIITSPGAQVLPPNAMGALVIDVTKRLNTKSIAADSTFTFSGIPASDGTLFVTEVTNTDSASHTLTIPSSFSQVQNGNITSVVIAASGKLLLTWLYLATAYNIWGDPVQTTGTGSTVLSNSPTLVTPALGTPASGNLSNTTVDGTNSVGFRDVPSNSQSANYTTVLADRGCSIDHPASDANARTFTIAANGSVAYPIGTCISWSNMTSQVLTIAIASDTQYLAGAGTTGNRSLAQYGMAVSRKLTATTWMISGTGLT